MPRFLAPPVAAPLGDVTTERMVLRRFAAGDLDALAAVFAADEVWRFPYGRGFTRDETAAFLESQLAHWAECRFGCWFASDRETGEAIGFVGLSVPMFLPEVLPAVEVGWRFHPAWWGRGLATEGAVAALTEGFTTLGLDEIVSVPQDGNPASARVAERIGMRLDRRVVIPATDRREELVGLLYVMTADEWWASRA
ncbi:MAG: GNAT family N-acetyltransferase [Actinomycetota bacterium]|nr:GNAT family N-acetyltransferase [Actinomycetota bacterium]